MAPIAVYPRNPKTSKNIQNISQIQYQDVTRRKFLIRHLNVVIRPQSSYNHFPNKKKGKKHGPQLKNIPKQCLVKQNFFGIFPQSCLSIVCHFYFISVSKPIRYLNFSFNSFSGHFQLEKCRNEFFTFFCAEFCEFYKSVNVLLRFSIDFFRFQLYLRFVRSFLLFAVAAFFSNLFKSWEYIGNVEIYAKSLNYFFYSAQYVINIIWLR